VTPIITLHDSLVILSRSTKDLDLFLTADVIADAERMNALRDLLAERGYTSRLEALYFQFERSLGSDARSVRIDLLTAPPRESDRDRVKIKGMRVRPNRSDRIHAYLTHEASAIERGAITVRIPRASDADSGDEAEVMIASSFNYLILKLHAFGDRHDDPLLAGHHALDIFRIVTDMSESDWWNAAEHRRAEGDLPYLVHAAEIRQRYFENEHAPGILALRETEAFQAGRRELEIYLSDVIADLRELFG
jgi:hypothetical protein